MSAQAPSKLEMVKLAQLAVMGTLVCSDTSARSAPGQGSVWLIFFTVNTGFITYSGSFLALLGPMCSAQPRPRCGCGSVTSRRACHLPQWKPPFQLPSLHLVLEIEFEGKGRACCVGVIRHIHNQLTVGNKAPPHIVGIDIASESQSVIGIVIVPDSPERVSVGSQS